MTSNHHARIKAIVLTGPQGEKELVEEILIVFVSEFLSDGLH